MLIGEKGVTLQRLMAECFVLIEVPRANEVGEVLVHGRCEDCLRVKAKVEELLRETVPLLALDQASADEMPLPPAYDLATPTPIRRCLFFPENSDDVDSEGLTSLRVFLKFLDSARLSCDACIFTITDNRIARRLLDAHRFRGVKVRIISDRTQSEALGSDIAELQKAGIQVRMNDGTHHMHHKFCILDRKVLMNGSFNWTQGACEHNSENVMVTNEGAFVEPFCTKFDTLWRSYAS
jgi:phosphatidylserine/phosphatidylglycerophosphate/cardiolipin synthase-like enzyme